MIGNNYVYHTCIYMYIHASRLSEGQILWIHIYVHVQVPYVADEILRVICSIKDVRTCKKPSVSLFNISFTPYQALASLQTSYTHVHIRTLYIYTCAVYIHLGVQSCIYMYIL